MGLEGPTGGAAGPGAAGPGAGVLLMAGAALAWRGRVPGSVLAPRGWVLPSRAPLEGAPGPGQGGGTGGSGAWLCPGSATWKVTPRGVVLPVVLAVLVAAVPSPWAQCPAGVWGGVRAGAPVPAGVCWSLIAVAVPLSADRCLGTWGSCPVAGWLAPLWAACSAAAGEELSEEQGGAVCSEGRAGCKTCCWLQHFVSCDTENVGMGVPKRLLSRNFSLCFAPDVF